MPQVRLGPMSLDVPYGWTLSTVIIVGPMELSVEGAPRRFQPNFIATMEAVAPDADLYEYLERQVAGLRKAQVEFVRVHEPKEVTLGTKEELGLLVEQIIVGPEGDRIRQLQLTTIKDDVAHTLIASHSDGPHFEAARDEFRRLLESFE